MAPPWSDLIPESQWRIFLAAAETLRRVRVPFLLGGALAVAYYTRRLRNTKDVDLFIRAGIRTRAIEALRRAGFRDLYDECPYDRAWIFRGVLESVIVDLIWTTPNQVTPVTSAWFRHARSVLLQGQEFGVIPAEELIWIKLFVMQRPRCDWPDLVNMWRVCGNEIDWGRLMQLAGTEIDLLRAALTLFGWISPQGVAALPPKVRRELKLARPAAGDLGLIEERRVAMLDSRPWYAAFQPETELMTV